MPSTACAWRCRHDPLPLRRRNAPGDRGVRGRVPAGGERRGAPVTAFVRVDDRPIWLRCDIERPDHLLVFDPSILDDGQAGEDALASSGVGRTLMTAFARQLRGRAELVRNAKGGVTARLLFLSHRRLIGNMRQMSRGVKRCCGASFKPPEIPYA